MTLPILRADRKEAPVTESLSGRRSLPAWMPVTHPELFALIGLPLILILLNRSWTFLAPQGSIDPYIYTGFFVDLHKSLNVLGPTYYGSRLPWLLLGHTLYSIMPVDAANLMLRLILFYTAMFSMFSIVYVLWRDRLAATGVAMVLGVHPFFLGAIGWDYVDGAGVVATLLTIACLTVAARARVWQPLMFCAGMAALTTVSINLFLISLLPVFAVWYILIGLPGARQPVLSRIALFAVGAGAAFAAYGLINYYLTATFNYLKPQIDAVGNIDPARWKAADYGWLRSAMWLVCPAVGLGVSFSVLALAIRPYRNPGAWPRLPARHFFAAAAAVQMVLASAVFLSLQLFTSTSPLQWSFYASYLIPFAFIAIGGALALGLSGLSRPGQLAAGALVFIILLTQFAIIYTRLWSACGACASWAANSPLDFSPAIGLVALLVILLLLLAAARQSLRFALTAVAAISLLNVETIHPQRLYFARQDNLHDRFLLVHDAAAAVRPFNPDGTLRFWYDFSTPLGPVYRAVASMHRWAFVSEDFPQWTSQDGSGQPLQAGQTAAIFATDQDDTLPRAQTALGQAGLRAQLLDRQTIRRGDDALELYLIRVVPQGSAIVKQLAASTFAAADGIALTAAPDGRASVTTRALRWSYAALLPIPIQLLSDFGEHPVLVHVRARVDRARAGFGLLKTGGTGWVDVKSLAPTSNAVLEVILTARRLADVSDLVVMTWDSDDSTRVNIDGVFISIYGVDGAESQSPALGPSHEGVILR